MYKGLPWLPTAFKANSVAWHTMPCQSGILCLTLCPQDHCTQHGVHSPGDTWSNAGREPRSSQASGAFVPKMSSHEKREASRAGTVFVCPDLPWAWLCLFRFILRLPLCLARGLWGEGQALSRPPPGTSHLKSCRDPSSPAEIQTCSPWGCLPPSGSPWGWGMEQGVGCYLTYSSE